MPSSFFRAVIVLLMWLPSSASADPLLNYCLQHLKNIGQPVTEPVERHRQFAQLILLQDQLKMLAQQGNSESLGRCTLALDSALLPYQQRQALPNSLMALQIQLRQLEHSTDQEVSFKQAKCQQGLPEDQPAHIELSAREVWRYLYQAHNDDCKQQVWRAYQNRGGEKATLLLSQHQKELAAYAKGQGFASISAYQIHNTPLRSDAEIHAFLDALPNSSPKLPWHLDLASDNIEAAPADVARNSLMELAAMFALTLKPIDTQQWQVWEAKRFLGYIHLQAGRQHQAQQMQAHWIGVSPAVVQLQHREKPWKSHHWTNWLALVAESFVNMAGANLPYQAAPISGMGTGFGRALARDSAFQQKLLGHTVRTRPLLSSQALFDAQMALVVSQQSRYDEAELQQLSDQLFTRYFQHAPPRDLKPWRSRSDWAISGARAYLPLWQAEQGRQLVAQMTQGQISANELWQRLVLAQSSRQNISDQRISFTAEHEYIAGL